MASIAFTFVHSKEGMQSVSYNMEDGDLKRVFDMLKREYMRVDQNFLDTDNPRDDKHDHVDVKEGDYTMHSVFNRLSDEFISTLVNRVYHAEVDKAIEGLDIQLINIKDK